MRMGANWRGEGVGKVDSGDDDDDGKAKRRRQMENGGYPVPVLPSSPMNVGVKMEDETVRCDVRGKEVGGVVVGLYCIGCCC